MGILGIEYMPYQVLSGLYDGFKAPTMKIIVNDNILTIALSSLLSNTSSGLMTDGVSITLNRDSASSAKFNLINCYNLTRRTFERKLTPGSKIAIKLGYGSTLRTVFVGYVENVSYTLSENPTVSVTAFDAVKLMMDSPSVEHSWEDGKLYIETISDIMEEYKDIAPLLPFNMQFSTQKHGYLVQRSNNYRYVKDVLCKYCCMDLLVKNGLSYLIDYKTQFGKLTELGFGKGLTDLTVNSGYKKVRAVVTGDKRGSVVGRYETLTGENYKKSMNKPQVITSTAPLKTNKECVVYAKRLVEDAVREVCTSSGSCIGIPDIVPGVGLGYTGVDKEWEGKVYYVDSVTHTFNASGYKTSFQTKGWR